ncbi:MAG: PAS domain S-box protein, partial [Deltaproteobacteria bacterium]|nr:PAS domain S-box protein [Deltaproteobacteria bacterium]MBW2115417.1 PAS domain S-box protein [Deltaproteobacteria bacterium]
MGKKATYEELEKRIMELETEALESKRANEALRASALSWNTTFDAITDSVCLIDVEGKILQCNKATADFLGKPINEIVGNTCWELVHGTSGPIKGCPIVRMRETRRPESLELPVGDRVLYVFTEPILDQDGNVAMAVHTITDITERKQVEESLRQSESELRIRNQINNIFLTYPDEKMYEEVLKAILKVMESEYGTFEYFDEDGSFVAPAVSRKIYWEKCNVPEKEIIFQKGTFGGIWGRAIKEKKTLISNDGPFNTPKGHIPIENTMVTPIIFHDELISAIHIANKPNDYDEKDRALLETIADQIAPVLYARLQRDKQDKERKKTEETLQTERDNLRNIFESIEDGIYIVNQQYDIQYVNPVLVKDFGLYEGVKCYRYFHDRDEVCPWCKNKDVWAGKTVRWEWYSFKNGRTYDLIDTPLTLPDGSIGKLEIFRDITDMKQAEEAVRESELKYRGLFDNSTDFIYTMDLKGNFTDVNKAAEHLTGYTKNELIGMNFRSYTQKDTHEEIFQAFISVIKEGKPLQDFPLEVIIKDGTKRYFETSVGPLKKDNDIIGFQGSSRDITERKQADEKIKHLNLVLRAIRTVNQIITKEKDCDKLLQGACNNLVETRGYYNSWIALLDENGGLIESVEAGLGDDFLPMIDRLKHGEMPYCVQRALAEQDVVIIEDSLTACAGCPLAGKYVRRGGMTCRVEHEGRVYGVMTISIPRRYIHDEEEQGLFKEVVNDIAFALHNIEQEEKSKRAEETLRESERRYRLLAENVTDVIWTMDMNLRFTYLSPSITGMGGYSVDEAMALSLEELLTPASLEIAIKAFKEEMAAEKTQKRGPFWSRVLELEQRRKDDSTIWTDVRMTFLRDPEGRPVEIVGVTRDITKRKRMEEALRESEEKFKSLSENAPDIIFTLGKDGSFTYINQAFERILGYKREEALGKYFVAFAKKEDIGDHVRSFKRVSDRKERIRVRTLTLLHKDGSARIFDVSGAPNIDSAGEVTGMVALLKNITEYRKLEAQLQQAQKMEAIGT